jgi:hypothetical protein
MMAVAENNPSKLYKKNRGVLKMGAKAMHDFAATARKGLPKRASAGDLMSKM